MNVLFVASECAPFAKTGGLADVIGAVPKALADMDHTVKVLMPAYPALAKVMRHGEVFLELEDLFGGPARVVSVKAKGIDLLLLEAAHLYDREGSLYVDEDGKDWDDNPVRFAALSLIGAKIGLDGIGGWKPDVVNVHDWQAGLVPVYLKQSGRDYPPVVTTIHNIAFQGMFDASIRQPLGLSEGLFNPDGYEFYGKVGYLKGALALSEKITTVSPTYARELMHAEYGMGLDGLLRSRRNDLVGILNGIDLSVWNPEEDPVIAKNYTARTLKRKYVNREALEQRMGLKSNPDAPLFCVVSRLTEQKGLDILLEILPSIVQKGGRLALLGAGEKWMEQAYLEAADRFEGSVGVEIGYDEKLSHLMQAGSDAILIPSRFEPCGLTQLYGLRYGTIPVVARTGGLADTVIDANAASLSAKCATGLQFMPVNADGLEQAIDRACALFKNTKQWKQMMRRAMAQEVGWDQSASLYADLFASLIKA